MRELVKVRAALAVAAATVLTTASVAAASAGQAGPAVQAGSGRTAAEAGSGRTAAVAAWRVVKTVRAASMPQFQSIAVTSAVSAWAFAQTSGAPAAWRLRGGTWSQAPFPGRPGGQVLAAGASAAGNVWAFESLPRGSGRALRWDGTRWTVARQFAKVIMGGLVLGPRDVWVFGSPYVPGNGLGTWHYNGSNWTRFPAAGGLTTASALSPSSIWAAGGTTAAHWNGSRWTLTSLAGLLPPATHKCHPALTAIYAASATSVWAAGAGMCDTVNFGRHPFVLLHFNGRSWQRVTLISTYGEPYQVVPDGSGGLWIPVITGFPGTFTLLHRTASGSLQPAPLPEPGSRFRMSVARDPGSATAFGAGTVYNSAGVPAECLILKYGT